MRNVLVLGATSAIAVGASRFLAADGDSFFLVARNVDRLQAVKDDLLTRGAARVEWCAQDLADCSVHAALVAKAEEVLGAIDLVLVAFGVLGDHEAAQANFVEAQNILQTNFVSVVSLLTLVANRFERAKKGTIVVVSSVAGVRGRPSNYVYGASKGGLNIFLEGLRARLFKAGVDVITINPGFVDTPMTAHLQKNPLFASPEKVGQGIYHAILKRRAVVFLPWFWRPIMLIIRHIPETIFKRLKL